MKKLWFCILLVILMMISSSIWAQDLETDLLAWLEKHSKAELRNRLDSIRTRYPNSPVPLFLEAYIEENGDRAIDLYKRVIEQYPDSKFTDLALLKLALYYYAIGSYVVARQYVDNLTNDFPESRLVAEAKYLNARCLIADGYYASAKEELKAITKKFSMSPFSDHAKIDLASLDRQARLDKNPPLSNREVKNPKPQVDSRGVDGKYTIQVGAFQDKKNASMQRELYSKQGYLATIETKRVNNNLFYLVWVGEFETEEQAARLGDVFKNLYGISFRVVKK